MRNEITKFKTFERRILILGGIKMAIFSAMAGRLYYLQVIKSDEFKTMSDGNRIKLIPVMPPRGKIIDRNGSDIANNHSYYRVLFEPYGQKTPVDLINKTMLMLGMPIEKQQMILKKFSENPNSEIMIEEYLQWDQVSRIEVNKPDLPGVSVEMGQVRFYPFSDSASHIIGYIGPVSPEEAKDNVIMSNPDFRVGKNGIEKIADEILQGKPGIRKVEVNAYGTSVRDLSIEESESGRDLRLTIDIDLQKFASERLKNIGGVKKEGGSAVVIDVENGDIVAMVSRPSFDTNNFLRGISIDLWKELTEDPDVPLVNKAISNQYPPGSTFKCVVALAGLESGAINRNTTFFCPGYFMLGSRRFNCWKKEGHGRLNVVEGLSHSCNVFFYNTAQRVGVEKIAEMSNKFGLGHHTKIELPNEKPGLIPTKEWKRKIYGKDWMAGETINTGIGQGYVLVTPLQQAVMTARIASGGKKIVPRLVKGGAELMAEMKSIKLKNAGLLEKIKSYNEKDEAVDIEGVSKGNIDLVRQGMEMVVNSPTGTAYMSRISVPGMEMAGKTGTAQVKGHGNDGSTQEPTERKFKNHALFVGFAPVANPKFAIAVVIEHGSKGSATAAPAGRDILLEAQRLFAMRNNVQAKDEDFELPKSVKQRKTEPLPEENEDIPEGAVPD